MTATNISAEIAASYLLMQFPVSEGTLALGADFMRGLFPAQAAARMLDHDADLGAVLEEVVADIDAAHPGWKVVIPLTEGLDSRGILGAALRIIARERILCFTVGEPGNEEVVAAREVCRRNGLEHVAIDPQDYAWDEATAIDHAAASFRKFHAFGGVETPVFASFREHCRRMFGGQYYMLSGFLGGVNSGAHLATEGPAQQIGDMVEAFIRHNRTYWGYEAPEELRNTLAAHGERMCAEITARGYPGMTLFDALDVSLRQGLRIRSGVHIADTIYAPLADPRIMSWWYGPVPRERLGQARYRAELAGRYGEMFCLADDKVRRAPVHSLRRRTFAGRMRNKVMNRLRARIAPPYGVSERGDLRTNTQKRDLLVGLVEGFGRRGLVDLDTGALIRSLDKRPTGNPLNLSISVASVEANIRAGNLDWIRRGETLAAGEAGMPPARAPLSKIA